MSTGLAGLAGVWRLGANLYELPALVSTLLYWVASILFAFLVLAFSIKLIVAPRQMLAELMDSTQAPFYALLPVSGMLLAQGYLPTAQPTAAIFFFVFFGMALLLGGWMSGQWIANGLQADALHPGYLLPTVTASLVAAEGAAHFGAPALGWMSFGIGVLSYLSLGTLILQRLFRQPLPAPLHPTLAILMSPPVVAGNAYFALAGDASDGVALGLVGCAILMALVQIRLLPVYRKLGFTYAFWSFTFPYAAAARFAMRRLHIDFPGNDYALGLFILAMLTALIGSIGIRSALVALRTKAYRQIK